MFPEFPFFELVTRDVIHKVVQDLKDYTSQMNFGEEKKKKNSSVNMCSSHYCQRLPLFMLKTPDIGQEPFLQSDE